MLVFFFEKWERHYVLLMFTYSLAACPQWLLCLLISRLHRKCFVSRSLATTYAQRYQEAQGLLIVSYRQLVTHRHIPAMCTNWSLSHPSPLTPDLQQNQVVQILNLITILNNADRLHVYSKTVQVPVNTEYHLHYLIYSTMWARSHYGAPSSLENKHVINPDELKLTHSLYISHYTQIVNFIKKTQSIILT